MVQFFVKRLIGLIFVIIGVTFITFILGYLAPGDPIRQQMGDHFDLQTWMQLRHAYGLDLPWYQQYYNFLTHLVKFNFGLSFKYQNRAVWDILKDGVPVSAELGFWGLMIELLLGIPVGIYSALKANTWLDTIMDLLAVESHDNSFTHIIIVQHRILEIEEQPFIATCHWIDDLVTGDRAISGQFGEVQIPGCGDRASLDGIEDCIAGDAHIVDELSKVWQTFGCPIVFRIRHKGELLTGLAVLHHKGSADDLREQVIAGLEDIARLHAFEMMLRQR